MKIIIVGGGLVGMTIAQHFSITGHEAVVIDRSPEVVAHVHETMDAMAIQGEATDRETLISAGLDEADLIMAVTNSDESNIVITLLAQARNPSARIILRVRGDQYLSADDLWLSERFGRTLVISPERAACDAVIRLLDVEQSFEVIPFTGGSLQVAGFRLNESSALVDKPLRESIGRLQQSALVVAVARGDEVMIPNGNHVLQPRDRIYLALTNPDSTAIQPLIGVQPSRHRKKVIVGGGWKGLHIALQLEQRGEAPVVIEKSRERCRELARLLPRSSVIHGDATQMSLLEELNIEHTTFVAVTGHQEVNFLISLMADKLGVNRAIALLDNQAYVAMAPALGIDAVVSPRLAAVREIMRFLGSEQVLDAAPMLDGRVEAILAEMKEGNRLLGVPLKEAKIPPGILAAAIMRGDETIIPDGSFRIASGDKALFIIYPQRRPHLDRLLAGGKA